MSLAYKQRELGSGFDPNLFSVGKKWNFLWRSYVTLDFYSSNVVVFPDGGQRTFSNSVDYVTHTILTGDTTNGFTLAFPDGSTNVYGFIINDVAGGSFLWAFMTEQHNPQGQKTRLDYYPYNSISHMVQLKDIVDGDGRTNLIYYVSGNSFSPNLIGQVVDPFGRTNSLADDTNGHLTAITDVLGLTNTFTYDTNDFLISMTTPYGTTSFTTTDETPYSGTPSGRSVLVTEPDGSHELFLFQDSAPGVLASYGSGDVPVTSPYGNNFDNSNLNLRNTFHWGKRQYAALSTTNIASLTTNDFRKARMQHWLASYPYTVGTTLSLERDPSPDAGGTLGGQKTSYDYTGKPASNSEGSQNLPLFVARVLSDGTTSFSRSDRNTLGLVTTNASTFSVAGTVYLRTNAFTYAGNNTDLLTVTNALGVQVSSNVYNGYHQVATNYDALNEKTVITYDSNQRVSSLTRPSGLVTTNIYGSDGWLSSAYDYAVIGGSAVYYRTNAFTYANDLVLTHTDPRGLTTTNTWDALQRLRRVDFPDTTYITNSYTNLDLIKVVDRMRFASSFGYDSMRRLIAATNAANFYALFNYCSCGALDSVVDPAGNYTHFYYDNQGRGTNVVYPDGFSITNWFNLPGQITNVIDSSGSSATNWFNNQGLPIALSNALGQASALIYDPLDRVTNAVDANGVTVTNTFDNLNRLLTRGYPDGGVEQFGYTLNVAGVTSYTNQLGTNLVNYTYDPLGRKTIEVYPALATNQFSYSPAGDLTVLTDPRNNTTTWHFDQFGRITNKVDAASNVLFTYQYDPDNRLTNRTSAAKGSTTFKFDALGNVTNIVYPVNPSVSMAYDAMNRLTNMIDGIGAASYSFDPGGRLLSEGGLWTDGAVSYTYNNRLRSSLKVSAPNASSWVQTYSYDGAKRLTNVVSPAGSFAYLYDPTRAAAVGKITLPSGAFITNVFDNVARLLSTTLKSSGLSTINSHSYQLNPLGQRTNQAFTAGNYINYSYDNLGQLKSALGSESGGATRWHEQFGYAYDPAGNLNYRTNNALLETFGANSLNELSTLSRTGALTVAGTTTSPATNVTVNSLGASLYADSTFARTNLSVASGNNTFTAIASDSYGRSDTNAVTVNLPASLNYIYDLNGNLLSDGFRGFDYDDENQLIRITVTNGWKSEFTYDGRMRRRIRKEFTWQSSAWVQTNEVRYLYDGSIVVQERDGNNLPVTTYTRQGLRLLARSDMRSVSPTHAYYHTDGNANVTALINANQALVARYLYDPFGNMLSKSGALADANVYQFASGEVHGNSGLSYFVRRFYDPTTQRWLNRDPIGEGGGANLYAYGANCPVSFVDPEGLCWSVSSLALSSVADWFDRWVNSIEGQITTDNTLWNYEIYSQFGTVQGLADLLRYGTGYEHAIYEASSVLDAAISIYQDNVRAGSIVLFALPLAESVSSSVAYVLQRVQTLAAEGGIPQFIYRTGSQTENALTDAAGVSFRDSISSSANRAQVFDPGAKIWAVDTSKLAPGSVVLDGNPAGHVSVLATPSEIRAAIVQQSPGNPLSDFGLKLLEDGSSYRIPRK
jgi:RHS repeat-associated protein